MRRVICIGTAVIDTIFAVDRLPLAPGKNPSSSVKQVCGGLGANAAATVSALGGEGVLWSRIGDDAPGEAILRELEEWRVDTAAVQRVSGCASVIATVLVDRGGERQIVYRLDHRLVEGAPRVPLDDIASAGALMADTWWPTATVPALEEAKTRGIPSVLDVEVVSYPIETKLIELASHVLFAAEGLAVCAGTTDVSAGLRAMQSRTDAWLGVTCGGEGAFWLDGNQVRHVPAFEVDVVDTLAAGDVFHGALALALAEDQEIQEALRFAAAAAAVKCTRFGGRDGIPKRTDVARLLAAD